MINSKSPVTSIILMLSLLRVGETQSLSGQIPSDTSVHTGKLANGLTYYVKRNLKPEKRAELRLVVNAGSVLENDDQRGLAHFNEHMGFSGSKNFKKDELISFMQTLGIKWGEDLNAYTSFDETVYKLTVPTDSEEIVKKGMQVIEDWAHNLTYEPAQIERERGIVISELRLGLGPWQRMFDKTFPIEMQGSRYADRIVIGKLDILEHCTPGTLKQYNLDWYRPDLMAVIAVGDFDVNKVEKMIREKFSPIPVKSNPRPRTLYPVPDTKELLIAKATDKEAPLTSVEIVYKHERQEMKTLADLRQKMIFDIYNAMFNIRLEELQKSADPPFLYGYENIGELVRTKDSYTTYAWVSQKGIERGIETLITENERVRRYGFTSTELDREKKELLRKKETELLEKDKTMSDKLINTYIDAYLENKSFPGIDFQYEFYKNNIDDISLEDVNKVAAGWITRDGTNAVIIIHGPDNDSLIMPPDDTIRNIFNSVGSKQIDPYVDWITNEQLMEHKPFPGKVINEKKISEAGITEWTLSNGVNVILKPTDFKNDEILFNSFRWGGTSLYPDNDYMSASVSDDIVEQSGVGDFNATILQKLLMGKIVKVHTSIDDINTSISGNCSHIDFETAMQLVNLYCTSPRYDASGYNAAMKQLNGFCENKGNDPNWVFYDSIRYSMGSYNLRRRPLSIKTLKEVNSDRAFEIYKESFSDANGLTFIIVGSFNTDSIKPLVESYLGGLPSTKTAPEWKDAGIELPTGILNKNIIKGVDPNSNIEFDFSGPFAYSNTSRFNGDALVAYLNIKIPEQIRIKMGLVYGAWSSADYTHYPKQQYRLKIEIYGAAPEKVPELISATMGVIDSIKQNGISLTDLTKVKKTLHRQREIDLKDNQFWLKTITRCYEDNSDIHDVFNYNKEVEQLSKEDFKKIATSFLNTGNYATFVLKPEN